MRAQNFAPNAERKLKRLNEFLVFRLKNIVGTGEKFFRLSNFFVLKTQNIAVQFIVFSFIYRN